jgi:hypothetical protein
MMAIVQQYKDGMEARYRERLNRATRFVEQWYLDMAVIAAAETLTDDPDRLRAFATAMEKNRNSFINDIWSKDTADAEYSMSVLDRRLEEVCGKYFVPYTERYDDCVWEVKEKEKDNVS